MPMGSRILVGACANPSLPTSSLAHTIADAPNASPSSVTVSRPSSVPGAICSFHRTRIHGGHHGPLPVLLPLASACLFSTAAAWAADMDTAKGLVDGLMSREPANALSLPTWTIHVASVVEWVIAMGLVWRFGDDPKNTAWKGLTWGMVPLLGGAMCACTWHFFYNAESLEILVVLQAALTMIGNFTMWLAAYRIYQSSAKSS